jgi:DNA-3-methyladenine glycosylase I
VTPFRCFGDGNEPYEAYHDDEWGQPVTDARHMLERLCLEGFQAGLAWITILRKRENFRAAFAGFDPAVVATFGDAERARLMEDAGIVRNRLKIEATIANAQAALAMEAEGVDLAELVWSYAPSTTPKSGSATS